MLNRTNQKAEILIVDDIPANLKVLSKLLLEAQYGVAAMTSGKRALNRLQNDPPDLILLDIQMPEMDGFETCRQIKANSDTAHIPIIFITALSDIDSIAKGFSLGAVDYICKPFQEAELLARVHTHLKLQSFTQELEHQVGERTSELQQALTKLEKSRLELIQHEKMSALGNLVAGVAHEINNPVGFLNGSISNAKEYVHELFKHLRIYQSQQPPNEVVQDSAEDIDLEFLLEDLPKLLDSMQRAADRVKDISTSLRTFSRADTDHQVSANVHDGLDSTLLILKYRLKAKNYRPAIEVIKHYGELSEIYCFPGQLNQVFMNIVANAIDMFDDMAQTMTLQELKTKPQRITIQTECQDNQVLIRIGDNGKGMPADVKARIFDHLFTTKAVGKGTGLGLAIARQIVEETHGGTLEVQSNVGQGTQFCIRLPL